MKKTVKSFVIGVLSVALMSVAAVQGIASEMTINGAGATFPYPLYSKWFYEYSNTITGIKFNYQAIGSGGGINQITAGTVDFGATDAPMSEAEMGKLSGPILHIPTAIGAVAVIYNLEGVSSGLRLTQDLLADIFMGKVTKWNDPRIVELNKDLKLPNADVVIAHRSDGSGTTDIFTNYLSEVNSEWNTKVGRGRSIKWPRGIGGKGNEGLAGIVKQTPGAIGYVELAFANQNKLASAMLRNSDGQFVAPTLAATSAAAAGAAKTMPTHFRVSLVNSPGKDSYPIAGLTWLLVYTNQKDEVRGKALVQFLKWAITEGQTMAEALDYAPLPKPVVDMVDTTLKQINYQGKSLY